MYAGETPQDVKQMVSAYAEINATISEHLYEHGYERLRAISVLESLKEKIEKDIVSLKETSNIKEIRKDVGKNIAESLLQKSFEAQERLITMDEAGRVYLVLNPLREVILKD